MENANSCRTVTVATTFSCGKDHCGACRFADDEYGPYCILFREVLKDNYSPLGLMRCEQCLLASGELS
jgi:hypothetical protein